MSTKPFYHSVCSVSLLLLCACGGGSSSDTAGPNPPKAPLCYEWPNDIVLPSLDTNSIINAIAPVDSCDLLVAGYYGSTDVAENQGNSTGFIRRLHVNQNQQVELVWEMALSTAGSDGMEGISVTDDGILAWGQSSGQVFGHPITGKMDAVVYKLSPGGEVIFGDQFGTACPDTLQHFYYLDDSTAFIAVGNHEVCVQSNYVESWEDPFIATGYFDPSGITSLAISDENSVAQDIATVSFFDKADNAAYIGTSVFSEAERGIWLRKIDSAGNLQWQRQLTNVPYDIIASVKRLENGALRLIGTTASPDIGETFFGGPDIFVMIVDPENGDIQSVRRFGTANGDWVTAVAESSNGALFVLFDSLLPDGGYLNQVIDLNQQDGQPTVIAALGNNQQTKTMEIAGKQLIIGGYYFNGTQSEKHAFLKSVAIPGS